MFFGDDCCSSFVRANIGVYVSILNLVKLVMCSFLYKEYVDIVYAEEIIQHIYSRSRDYTIDV